MATRSSRRHAPTGSMLTAASLPSGRFARARRASNCSPAGWPPRRGPSTSAGRTAREGRSTASRPPESVARPPPAPARRPARSRSYRGCGLRPRCRWRRHLPRAAACSAHHQPAGRRRRCRPRSSGCPKHRWRRPSPACPLRRSSRLRCGPRARPAPRLSSTRPRRRRS